MCRPPQSAPPARAPTTPRPAIPEQAVRSISNCDDVSQWHLLHPCAFPGIGRVAAVTLRAVLTQVPVIFVVTGTALLRHLHRAGRLVMTFGALQLAVSAQQSEMSLFGMIENP